MIRILLVFLVVFALALGGVWLADHPGTITVLWLGYEIKVPVAYGLSALGLIIGLVLVLNSFFGLLWRGASGMAAFLARRREARSRRLLAAGVMALASGDATAAGRAHEQLGTRSKRDSLSRFLAAETALAQGRPEEAKHLYTQLLSDPHGELIALLRLTEGAQAEGDGAAAREHARQAFRLDGANAEAFCAHVRFLIEDRAWTSARATVDVAFKARAITETRAKRITAALFTAEANERLEALDRASALTAAQKALSLDESCLPAALIAAEGLVFAGKPARAAAVIEAIWPHAPHPRLASLYRELMPDETSVERLSRLEALVSTNRSHPESRLLMAEAAMEAGRFDTAREDLEALRAGPVSLRVALAGMRLEQAEDHGEGAAERWLQAARAAEESAAWACGACGHSGGAWAPACQNCGALQSIAWQPRSTLGPSSNGLATALKDGAVAPGAAPDAADLSIADAALAPTQGAGQRGGMWQPARPRARARAEAREGVSAEASVPGEAASETPAPAPAARTGGLFRRRTA